MDVGTSWGLGDPWGSGRSHPSSDSSSNAALSLSHHSTPPVSHDSTLNSTAPDEVGIGENVCSLGSGGKLSLGMMDHNIYKDLPCSVLILRYANVNMFLSGIWL